MNCVNIRMHGATIKKIDMSSFNGITLATYSVNIMEYTDKQ